MHISYYDATNGNLKYATNSLTSTCIDNDGDGYGNPGDVSCPNGSATDCNDTNATINPGATEVCDNVDNNCDGQIDEGVKRTYYQDTDSDGYGNSAVSVQACTSPAGYVADNTDCNDGNALEHPNQIWYQDADNDGYSNGNTIIQCARPINYKVASELTATSGDCNDNNVNVHPGATEVCNGIDDNCNGQIDEGVMNTYYRDADEDGYGDPAITTQACSEPPGYTTNNTDCNDNDASVNPGATEVCDNKDNDCDGSVDENYVFGGFQQPINSDSSSIFQLGRTIPVKIILTDCSGQNISTATVTIAVYKITNAILGTEEELLVDSSGNANTGNLFRYDATEGKYIFNLSTKSYTKGTYKVYAKPDIGSSYSVNFSLK